MMIIVTGPGRSGTSFVAALYKELGFDPGGEWVAEANAGLEDHDVMRINGLICHELGITVLNDRVSSERELRKNPGFLGREPDPSGLFDRARRSLKAGARELGRRLIRDEIAEIGLARWALFPAVVEKYGLEMRTLAAGRRVVKNPFFSWTLSAWAAAGVPIEHVLICVRQTDAMVASRQKAGMVAFANAGAGKNSFVYGIGMCIAAAHDYRIPYNIVQFPDFIANPDALYESMRFPEPVTREAFGAVFARIRRDDLVHNRA
jgi:hypothetical protein